MNINIGNSIADKQHSLKSTLAYHSKVCFFYEHRETLFIINKPFICKY